MDRKELLTIYTQMAEELTISYLTRVLRITGLLSPGRISERFWQFNSLMQELEGVLNQKAGELLDLYGIVGDEKASMRQPMRLIAREACMRFNNQGKPGSGAL